MQIWSTESQAELKNNCMNTEIYTSLWNIHPGRKDHCVRWYENESSNAMYQYFKGIFWIETDNSIKTH